MTEDLSGHNIRGYELRDRIGTGGHGAIYRGYQHQVNREVVIKVILPHFANHPDFIRRFEAEAQLVARLEHPHIVPLYDYWREPDRAYLVMRWLRGGSLRDSLKNGPWDEKAIGHLLNQIGSALAYSHRQGIIHRDLKPENILLDEGGNVYLGDFGIAKDLEKPSKLTREGAITGSPAYISPEQVQEEAISPQTDIYSLGVMLFELLTGTNPFIEEGVSLMSLLMKHVLEPTPSLKAFNPKLSDSLDSVIQKATEKDPTARYPDVLTMVADFQNAIKSNQVTISGKEYPAHPANVAVEISNPFKGLRAFQEADAVDFFGRENLTERLLSRLSENGTAERFLAIVGPSGSGKSSVVHAGLIPSLKRGALPGSDKWFIVSVLPGTNPMEEIEIALSRISVRPGINLGEQLQRDNRGVIRASRLALPTEDSELLLVIDQFEELFTLTQNRRETEHMIQN
ncbi:MAG TPA: serine/threonine-protein kinase, partial [Anaerolineales bacterium]|nr:serine/threonine-protein kinase [Anaerolineales bacterium]